VCRQLAPSAVGHLAQIPLVWSATVGRERMKKGERIPRMRIQRPLSSFCTSIAGITRAANITVPF
jgi:hypothetical protein